MTKILEFGALVNFGFPQDGMVHISEIAPVRVERIEDYLSVGERVLVKVLGSDVKGRVKLSIKQANANLSAGKQ